MARGEQHNAEREGNDAHQAGADPDHAGDHHVEDDQVLDVLSKANMAAGAVIRTTGYPDSVRARRRMSTIL